METKKCPKCGAEIPVEMSFCLHCMERTDGVLEIKRKAVPSRKYVIAAIIAFAVLLTAIVLLIFALNGKDNYSEPEPVTASEAATETSTESVQADTTVQNGLTTQTQTTVTAETAENSTSTTVEDTVVSSEDSTLPKNEVVISTEDVPEEPVTTPVETTAPIAINFEEVFTERMNSWGAPHILADTLSFTGNGCTFTSNVGTDKVNCTVTADTAMTEYTLTIEPSTELTRYGTSIYIPDIVNEMTYFVLGRRMNSSTRTAIADMFENFEAGGRFTENGLTCDISTQAHNNGSYPITVNCKITE